jgi:hypothetical protein
MCPRLLIILAYSVDETQPEYWRGSCWWHAAHDPLGRRARRRLAGSARNVREVTTTMKGAWQSCLLRTLVCLSELEYIAFGSWPSQTLAPSNSTLAPRHS